jgi:hypothetical protein
MIRNNSKIFRPILNLLIFFLILFGFGCSAHSNLTPTGEGNIDAVVSLGGPFVPVAETKVPTPYLSAGANYGLTSNINLDANLHITSLFYELAGFDFGATWFPYLNDGLIPTWGIQPRLLMFGSFKSDVNSRFRIYPLISSSVAWKWGNGLIYSGFDFVYPLTTPDYDDEAVKVIFSPFAGYRWELGKNLQLLTELKWHGANVQGDQLAVEYITIGGYGALTIMFSLQKRF